MGGSRMGGSRMGGSRMGGSRMGGSRMANMGGSRMAGLDGSRMGGSMTQTQGDMEMGTQQTFGAPQNAAAGKSSKIILNEDEILIEGVRFVEKKTLKNDGYQTYLTHSRTIGEADYEVIATVQNGEFVQFDVNTNLENEEEIYMMEQMWVGVWPTEDQLIGGASMMQVPSAGMTGSKMVGSRMAGSRMAGSKMAGSRMAGSKMAGSRMAGSKMAGSRMAGSRAVNAEGSKMAASNAYQ